MYIQTDRWNVLSISPELFFHFRNGRITLKPIKSTRSRGRWFDDDKNNEAQLHLSEKDKAENLMIVDLIRNDLGKVAKIGTVTVPKLFEIESYRTVWQMTSTISGETEKGWVEVLSALFPPGSVTGAPKIYAMKMINEHERYPRGIYCGTLGWITPYNEAIFNVAIRTLVYNRATRETVYYVGSGIVWDSEPIQEWGECLAKANVLQNFPFYFELIETMRVERGEIFLLDYHLSRLERSAHRFSFPISIEEVKKELIDYVSRVNDDLYRLRLSLNPNGLIKITHEKHIGNNRIRLGLAKEPIDNRNVFLYHKTTCREFYEQRRQQRTDCEDVLLWNADGCITESTIANVVVQFGDKKYTPPVHCGLLSGTFRQYLIDTHQLEEKEIRIDQIRSSDAIFLINSVRKWIDVDWID